MRTLFIIAAALLAVALPTSAALASRDASKSEKQQLRKAVSSSKLVAKKIRRGGHFKLRGVRISTAGPWAKAAIVPTGVYSDPFDPSRGLFKRSHGTWKLKVVGTSGVGCKNPRAPRAVRKDLKLRCR
jgi:hypothetical protein